MGALPRKSFAFMYRTWRLTNAVDTESLADGEPERLAGDFFAHALDLEQHLARQDPGDPVLDVALAAAHANLERLLRDRHVREHADPDPAAALHVARNGAARRLDLTRRHAATVGRLQAVLAERNEIAALRAARDLALELFAEFGPLRLHHVSLPINFAPGPQLRAGFAAASVSASGASASG